MLQDKAIGQIIPKCYTFFQSGPVGHTLDLVLSHELNVNITDISDFGISEHFPVLFTVESHCPMAKSSVSLSK